MESGFLLEQFSRACISPFLYFLLSFVALIRYFLYSWMTRREQGCIATNAFLPLISLLLQLNFLPVRISTPPPLFPCLCHFFFLQWVVFDGLVWGFVFIAFDLGALHGIAGGEGGI